MKQESQNPEGFLISSNARWYARPTENKNHKKNKTGPCKRWGHSTAIADNRFFIYGGTGYTTNSRYWESIYQLDLDNWDWTKIEPLNKSPSSRDSHSCIVYNNKLYIFGGSAGNDSINDMYEYDLAQNLWKKVDVKGDIPSPREGHAACLLDNRYMVIYGGWNGEETFDNCYLFDIPQKTWLPVSRMLGIKPLPMESQSCCMVRRDMYFFGGQGNSIQKDGESYDNFYNDLHRLRIRFDDESRSQASATWELIEPKGIKPSKRSSHSSCAYKDRYVFIVGGEGYPPGIDEEKQPVEYRRAKNEDENSEDYPCFPKNDVWVYDVELNQWTKLKIKNDSDFIPRFAHSNVIYKELLVVFGGLHDYHHSTNDIHVLCLDGGNPFQPKNTKFLKLFADDGNIKDDEQSQSGQSSIFHDEMDFRENKETARAIEPVRGSSRKASVIEPPRVEVQVQAQVQIPLERLIEEAPVSQKPLVSTNFVSSLANVISWPLAAFGLLLDNSLIVESQKFEIKYLTKQRKRNVKDIIDGDHDINDAVSYLVIEDNGQGWEHNDFIKILSSYETDEIEQPQPEQAPAKEPAAEAQAPATEKKGMGEEEKIFNSEEEEEEKRKKLQRENENKKKDNDPKKKRINEYAFNLKIASARLGKNIIILSNNGDEVSLGFISADRRFNPNLHRNHTFYYSWKKGTGEYLTKRAEKNRHIISNALAGIFTLEELASGIENVGNRIIILDLKTVMSFSTNNKVKQDLELLRVSKEGPTNVADIMVRTLDKNLSVFYHHPTSSLVELSLKTYLSYFFLDPTAAKVTIQLNGNDVALVNVKEAVASKTSELKAIKVGTEGSFEGIVLEQRAKVQSEQSAEAGQKTNSHANIQDILGKDVLNQGVLIYYKNRLIRRLESSKMGNLDFLSSQYRLYSESKERNPDKLFFDRSGYIELQNEFKPNAFKTEIGNPFYSNFLQGAVMAQVKGASTLNGKRVNEDQGHEDEEIVKKVKTTSA